MHRLNNYRDDNSEEHGNTFVLPMQIQNLLFVAFFHKWAHTSTLYSKQWFAVCEAAQMKSVTFACIYQL